MIDDSILLQCNETELLEIARRQGLGILRRGLHLDTLRALVSGQAAMSPEFLSGTMETRGRLEKFIYDNFGVTRSQLPGCNGHCPTYNCSDGRHAVCFSPNVKEVQ